MNEKHYIIGIDLGTTNSAVSYTDLSSDEPRRHIEIFEILQLSGPGELSHLRILPSFLYIPGGHEIHEESLRLPWDSGIRGFVGTFAREQGAKVPHRMVSSAKSWLCHGKVDRKAHILPWGSGEDVVKVSPVEAASAYLSLIKEAWNHSKKGDEDQYLEQQSIIITVPASFDEAARDLTVEAALQAGMKNIVLLEEPLAAFYSWLIAHDQGWEKFVRPGELILVCDVGGGTTDFTLITLRESKGKQAFDRIAVGDHLILGGDNMDLTLAHHCEAGLNRGQKGPINIHRWQAMCSQCRQAKEGILSGLSESKTITLVGEGRRLIADTLSTTLSRKEVEEIILDGFFPLIQPGEDLTEKPRQGITEFGLPYAQDPAITRHLIRFLERHKDDVKQTLGRDSVRPDLVLFNGAALKPDLIQDRILAAIRLWFNEKDEELPRVLANAELDLAVALGASYYGLVKDGYGIRVGSGSARAYFLGVGQLKGKRTEIAGPEMAICLVERGMEEGHKIELVDKEFHVLANQPVSFDLYSSSFRTGDHIGDMIDIDDSLTPLPPIHTVIQYGKKAKQTSLPVKVEACYTEVGTLALWCRSTLSTHRWRLQFQLRDTDQVALVSDQQVLEESFVDRAIHRVSEVFSEKAGDTRPELLNKIICEILDRPREAWPLYFIRSMADQLAELVEARKLSIEHESRWYNLAGFCLRPGFGDARDEHRASSLWKIFDEGPIHKKNIQVRSEWWVFWRRVAGGLSAKQQFYMSQKISSVIKTKKSRSKIKLAPQEHMEMWMALANLELLPGQDKAAWGRLLLDQLTPKKSRPQYWWSLSRLGARELLYGPIDRVVPSGEVTLWIEAILAREWQNPKSVGTALAQLARLTGDRTRDLIPEVLQQVIEWLSSYDWSGPCIKLLNQVIPITRQEESELFGESVPPGIVLHMEERAKH
jgi:hypothetical protein